MERDFKGHANKGGVYKITNTKNKKLYIGSAKNFKKRAYQHTSSLRNNKHQNKHLQASWNKWSEDAFLFEVIEVVEGNQEERLKVEQKWIDKLIKEQKWEQTFNFKKKTEQKERSCFSKTPEETRKLMAAHSKKMWSNKQFRRKRATKKFKLKLSKSISEAKKGHKHSEETKRKMMVAKSTKSIAVNQYTMNGKFINSYPSLSNASTSINKPPSSAIKNIKKACLGIYVQAYGYKWKLANKKDSK